MDISSVVANRYTSSQLCCGKTCRGRRCKKRTVNSYECYGVELPVCRYHEQENVIYDWSCVRNFNLVPDKIKLYLNFYTHCINCGIDKFLSLLITTELYKTGLFMSAEDTVRLFQNNIFSETSGECSVCYDTFENAVKTRCGHVFCRTCLEIWTTNNVTCPMCRKLISQS